MSIPKSKMISASKAIMALAAKGKYYRDESCRAIQNQTVTVNVQQQPTAASVITNTNPHTPSPSSFQAPAGQEPTAPASSPAFEEPIPVVERDIVLEPEEEPTAPGFYEELDNLHAIVNNYETVAKALILIIELLQSNPLKLNKIIVPTEPAFKELILVLTHADDVEIRYSEDIACGISSRKYRVIEDIIVVHNQEPKSLKYSHPDIIRLFDRFNISIRMIAKQ